MPLVVEKDDEQGDHGEHADYFGQDYVGGRIHPHDFECIDLLCHTHGTNFRGNIGANFSGKDETHDR